MTKRVVSRRDSATTILRKMGINSRDYDVFIKHIAGTAGAPTQFEVDIALAESHLKALQQQVENFKPGSTSARIKKALDSQTEKPVKEPSAKKPAVKKVVMASPFPIETLTRGAVVVDEKTGVASMPKLKSNGPVKIVSTGESLSKYCRTLILAGHSNEEVWLAINDQYKLDYAKQRGYPAWYRHKLRKEGHAV